MNGTPAHEFKEYFETDTMNGQIHQLKPADRNKIKRFSLVIKAEQEPPPHLNFASAPPIISRRFVTAKLLIEVLPVDKNPPILSASSHDGYVTENSAVGTVVSGIKDPTEVHPLKITVTDPDIVSHILILLIS